MMSVAVDVAIGPVTVELIVATAGVVRSTRRANRLQTGRAVGSACSGADRCRRPRINAQSDRHGGDFAAALDDSRMRNAEAAADLPRPQAFVQTMQDGLLARGQVAAQEANDFAGLHLSQDGVLGLLPDARIVGI